MSFFTDLTHTLYLPIYRHRFYQDQNKYLFFNPISQEIMLFLFETETIVNNALFLILRLKMEGIYNPKVHTVYY